MGEPAVCPQTTIILRASANLILAVSVVRAGSRSCKKGVRVLRLSIVIPTSHCQASLESTLISVLENRPANCEIMVACDEAYQDEYGLEDEIRFIRLSGGSGGPRWHEMANLGLAESGGDVLHLLQPGVRVEEGWVDSAIEMLDDDSDVAGVCPLVFDDDLSDPITGVMASLGGKRLIQRGTTNLTEHGSAPTYLAGFFRRASLLEVGGWDPNIAAEFADVELGCALASVGHSFRVAQLCRVKSSGIVPAETTGFAAGLAGETILRRYGWFLRRLDELPMKAAHEGSDAKTSLGYFLGRLAGRFRSTSRVGIDDLPGWDQNNRSRAA